MQYHEIGKTGMKVSSLSFGASSLGGVFHDLKEKEGIESVFTAVEVGNELYLMCLSNTDIIKLKLFF